MSFIRANRCVIRGNTFVFSVFFVFSVAKHFDLAERHHDGQAPVPIEDRFAPLF